MYATRKTQIGRTKVKIQQLFNILMNVLFLYLGARIKPYFVQCVKTKTTHFLSINY